MKLQYGRFSLMQLYKTGLMSLNDLTNEDCIIERGESNEEEMGNERRGRGGTYNGNSKVRTPTNKYDCGWGKFVGTFLLFDT